MTATNPSLIQRPREITPDAWERASWYARLQFVNALGRSGRPAVDPEIRRQSRADEYVERVQTLHAAGYTTLSAVAQRLNRTPDTVRRRLVSAGRRDIVDRLLDAELAESRQEATP